MPPVPLLDVNTVDESDNILSHVPPLWFPSDPAVLMFMSELLGRDGNKEKFLHVRRTCDHVRLTCPPIFSHVQKSCIVQRRTTSFAKQAQY